MATGAHDPLPCSFRAFRVLKCLNPGLRRLERRFLSETGMTLASWGRQARMLHGLRLLAAGEAVKSVAQATGYRTPSAFVAAFRTGFGQTPARYFAGSA